jgi:hypothetical protein
MEQYAPEFKEVALEKLRFCIVSRISSEFAKDCDIDSYLDFYSDMVVARVAGFVYGEERPGVVEHKPADWWEAFKSQYFSDWLLDRYPVKYKTYRVDVRCIYPDFRPAMPDKKHYLSIYSEGLVDN